MLNATDKKIILISIISFLSILYNIQNLSISYKEADVIYFQYNFLHYFSNFFLDNFGNNIYSLKLPFLTIHIFNIFLFYLIGKKILKKQSDAILLVALYSMTPAIYSAAQIVNSSIIVIFCTLLFINSYLSNKKRLQVILLIIFLFIDNSFLTFYLALGIYFLVNKNNKMALLSIVLFILSAYFYGFDSGGKPKGHFLDTILIYSLMFSILMFFAMFYSMYRNYIKDKKNIIWYICTIPFVSSIIISFRQKIHLEDFAPFVTISLFLVVIYYYKSIRIRLKPFQKRIKAIYYSIFVVLFLTTSTIIFNKYIFLILENPKKHFLYKYYVAKELSQILKEKNINSIYIDDKKLRTRLQFYGIKESKKYKLTKNKYKNSIKIDIKILDKTIKTLFVTKI